MANKRRAFRVAEKIRNLIATELLSFEDPRLSLVTITSVVVTADLRYAKVYWTAFGEKEQIALVEEAFQDANGVMRKCLAKGLGTKFVPQLKFFHDDTFETLERVDELMQRVEEKQS